MNKVDKLSEIESLLEFIIENYSIQDNKLVNSVKKVESKEEVVATFKTIYGQTKV